MLKERVSVANIEDDSPLSPRLRIGLIAPLSKQGYQEPSAQVEKNILKKKLVQNKPKNKAVKKTALNKI